MKKPLILAIFLILLLGVAALVYYGQWREQTSWLYYSVIIESTEANLAFQISGRVETVFVDEGQEVEKGVLLAELERRALLARRAQAQANVKKAQETRQQLEALLALYKKTLPAEVARAEANVLALKSKLKELETGYRMQEVERARYAFEAATLTMEDARKDKIRFERLYKRGIVSEKEQDAVRLRYERALKEYQRANEAFSLLKEGFRHESVEAARAKLAEGQAVLRQVKSNLKKSTSRKERSKQPGLSWRGPRLL